MLLRALGFSTGIALLGAVIGGVTIGTDVARIVGAGIAIGFFHAGLFMGKSGD